MQLRLKNHSEVRLFSVGVTLVALLGNILLQHIILPADLLDRVIFTSSSITIILAAPISFFVGLKILDVHKLTLQLEHAINHDGLTGVCTRASFYTHLEDMKERSFVVIAADIDLFKNVNDKLGHQAGDRALKQFAATLVHNCREDDVVARFGGEEFVILLRADTIRQGETAAQRLCDKVRDKPIHLSGEELHLTASFGVAKVVSVAHIDEAIHQADLALYRAKNSGRDQVCSYDCRLDGLAPARRLA